MSRSQFLRFCFGLFLAVGAVALRAQDNPGWLINPPNPTTLLPATVRSLDDPLRNIPHWSVLTQYAVAGGNHADAPSPEITELARSLRHDPVAIYNYVYHRIRFELYSGVRRGAALTLLEKAGNDADQCALLVSLLRASGYEAGYEKYYYLIGVNDETLSNANGIFQTFGVENLWGFRSAGATGFPVNLTGLPASFTNQQKSNICYLTAIATAHGYLRSELFYDDSLPGYLVVPSTVAVLKKPGTVDTRLSPWLKSAKPGPVPVTAAQAGFDRAAFLQQSGGVRDGERISQINTTAVKSSLQAVTTQVRSLIKSQHLAKGTDEFFGPVSIAERSQIGKLPDWPAAGAPWGSTPSVPYFTTLPDVQMAGLEIQIDATAALRVTFAQLQGRRLALRHEGNTLRVKLDNTDLLVRDIPNPTYQVKLTVSHGTSATQSQTWPQTYKKNDSYLYAIPYGFCVGNTYIDSRNLVLRGLLDQAKAAFPAAFAADGTLDYTKVTDTSLRWQILAESLNIKGLSYVRDNHSFVTLLEGLGDNAIQNAHFVGRVFQEDFAGYDFGLVLTAAYPRHFPATTANWRSLALPWGCLLSGLEHAKWDFDAAKPDTAVSTVQLLARANTNSLTQADGLVYLTSANWAANARHLADYTGAEQAAMKAKLDANTTAFYLLPGRRQYTLGQWSGHAHLFSTSSSIGMMITSGTTLTFGGYNLTTGFTQPRLTVPSVFIGRDTTTTPFLNIGHNTFNEISRPIQLKSDPVDFATGAFVLDRTDLTLGGPGVRGLAFGLSYRSNRRDDTLARVGHGWNHSYHFRLVQRSSPEAAFGSTSVPDAATFTAATLMLQSLLGDTLDVERLGKAAVLTKLALDEIVNNAVVIQLGNNTVEFIRQADGSYTSPQKSTATLTRSGDIFTLQERHGNRYRFDLAQSGRLLDITDPFDCQQTFNYDATGRLSVVRDHYNRTLTFGYTPGADTIETVTDSTSRQLRFTYLNGDLRTVVDPESKTTTYTYTNHLLTEIQDPRARTTVRNRYNAQNRIEEQWNSGEANRHYEYAISGYRNAELNPINGVAVTYYDEFARPVRTFNPMGETSVTRYDGQNRVVSVLSPRSEETKYLYDSDHNLTDVTDPKGMVTKTLYDSLHRPTTITVKDTDPATPDRVTLIAYAAGDTTSRPERVTTPDGRVTRFVYYTSGSGKGLPWKSIQEVPADGDTITTTTELTTTYEYDVWGNVSRITHPDARFERREYTARGDVERAYDAANTRSDITYNNRRQVRTVTTAVGTPEEAQTETFYDDAGDIEETKDPTGLRTRYTTSSQGKVLTVTRAYGTPLATTVVNDYNTRDLLARTTDPTGRQVVYGYDDASRKNTVTNSLNHTSITLYDANGQPEIVATPLKFITSFERDARGFVTTETGPDDLTVRHAPTGYGEPRTLTNRRDATWTYDYDGAGRLKTLTTPENFVHETRYNSRGLVSRKIEPSTQATRLYYDPAGRIDRQTDALGTINHGYDAAGRLESLTEGSTVLRFPRDLHGRVTSVTDALGDTIGYFYDKAGRLQTLVYPGGFIVTYGYDAAGRLETLTDSDGRVTTYAYDAADRLLSIKRPNGTGRTFRYDLAGRLDFLHEADPTGRTLVWRKFGYDADGRITTLRALPVLAPYSETPPAANYDNDNRLLDWAGQTIVHDADSNMTQGPAVRGGGVLTYDYDVRNRLTQADGLTYTYDPAGNRTAILPAGGAATRFTIDPHGDSLPRVLRRVKPDGTTTHYVYGHGLVYEVNRVTGAERHYHGDHLGSTLVLTDRDGTITDTIDYSPYGRITRRTGATDTPFLYVGLLGVQTDPNGLLYMRARYYHPGIMRFLNADPIGFGGGLNWYTYANGNPVMFNDPSGKIVPLVVLLGGAFVGALMTPQYANAPGPGDPVYSAGMQDVIGSAAGGALFNVVGYGFSNGFRVGATGGSVNSAGSRVVDIASQAPPIVTQRFQTINVTNTAEGSTILSANGRGLLPQQAARAQAGEIVAAGTGVHAEIGGVTTAYNMGLTPTTGAVSRPICITCQSQLRILGAEITSPTTYSFGSSIGAAPYSLGASSFISPAVGGSYGSGGNKKRE